MTARTAICLLLFAAGCANHVAADAGTVVEAADVADDASPMADVAAPGPDAPDDVVVAADLDADVGQDVAALDSATDAVAVADAADAQDSTLAEDAVADAKDEAVADAAPADTVAPDTADVADAATTDADVAADTAAEVDAAPPAVDAAVPDVAPAVDTPAPAEDVQATDEVAQVADVAQPDEIAPVDDIAQVDEVATPDAGDAGPPPCVPDVVSAPTWPTETVAAWSGQMQWGQTHLVNVPETRHAPIVLEGRDTLVLFTPDVAVTGSAHVAAFAGEQLVGELPMAPPNQPPVALEQGLTATPLAPYSTTAYSAWLPGAWLHPGLELRFGVVVNGQHLVYAHPLTDLGAPHAFTLTRTKLVLFGEPTFATDTLAADKLLHDYFAAVPVAQMRMVDTLPWRLDAVVVHTANGPTLVQSEAERLAVTTDTDHWAIIKNQASLRLNLANIGLGLAMTGDGAGDSSPYAFGTSVVMGWFRDPAGAYVDLDDAPYAAGWTGWVSIWHDECGNGFIHENGHALTLEHFTAGTAAKWGIAAEYPDDGVNLATHPWGLDSERRLLRTWYRVDANGPVPDATSGWAGKHDPMNGGEPSNAFTCFPQYTGYSAQKIQNWLMASPTLLNQNGVPGVYRWQSALAQYVAEPPAAGAQAPVQVGVPVATLVGTLAKNPGASQIYPPVWSPSGNVFAPPSAGQFAGSAWQLLVHYGDGTTDTLPIAHGAVTDNSLGLFSVNVEAARAPLYAELVAVDVAGTSKLVFTRVLTPPEAAFSPVLHVDGTSQGNAPMTLMAACEPGVNCGPATALNLWHDATPLTFVDPWGQIPPFQPCSNAPGVTVLTVPVLGPNGPTQVIVHGQKRIAALGQQVTVPLNDPTPWLNADDLTQSLELWIPYAENAGLVPGLYLSDAVTLTVLADAKPIDSATFRVRLEVLARTDIDVSLIPWDSPAEATPASSMYFVVRDPQVGPSQGVWWDDGVAGYPQLKVPVIDTQTGQSATLVLEGSQTSCGATWDMQAGRSADACTHTLRLSASSTLNPGLLAGHVYQTRASQPLVIDAKRWHQPNANSVVATFALNVRFALPPIVDVDLSALPFDATPLQTPASSMYFLTRDANIGPTKAVWWDDGVAGYPQLKVPMLDVADGSNAVLVLDGAQTSCGTTWDMNAGRNANNCTHILHLAVSATQPAKLPAGHAYVSKDVLFIDGFRWHQPNAGQLIGTHALRIHWTAGP